MRVLIALLTICLLNTSCATNDDNIEVGNILKSRLEKIITYYEEYVNDGSNKKYNPPIYEVTFKEYDGNCYLIVNSNNIYNPDLEGFIFINDKLVTFNNTSSHCNSGFVKLKTKIDRSKLSNYSSDVDNSDIYDPVFWEFEVNENNLVIKRQNSLKIDF